MNRLTRVAVLLTVVLGVLLPVAPATAVADPIGGLIVIPGSGNDVDEIRVRTSAGCPAKADAYYATVKGHGFPPDGQVVTANTSAGLSHRSGFDAYFLLVMRDYAKDNRTTLDGRYDISVFCIDSFTLQSYGEFTGSLEFTSATKFEALGAAKPTGPPPPPLEFSGDGAAVAPATEPPAGMPPAAGAQRPVPGADAPPGQLTSQRNDATGQGIPWLALVGGALVALIFVGVVIAAVNEVRKRRPS